MKKKLLSILLAIVLIGSCICIPAFAAGEFSLKEGWNAIVWEGGTVTLNGDVTATGRVIVRGDTVLDLNGHTITCAVPEDGTLFIVEGGVTLTVTGDGTIKHKEGEKNTAPLFYVKNTRENYIPAEYDEEGNRLSEEVVEMIEGTGRLVLEGGTFNVQAGLVAYIYEGTEAEIGAVTLNGGIHNEGTITSIRNTKITADGGGISNTGTIETIDGCEINTPRNGMVNFGEIGSITDTHLTATKAEAGAALNNQGYIGTVGKGVRIDYTDVGIGNDSKNSVIDMISMEYVKGGACAIDNRGTIGTIAAGEFTAEWHGMENSGTVNAIIGGNFNKGVLIHKGGNIEEISGGTMRGESSGIANGGTIGEITGGTFIGERNVQDEALKRDCCGISNRGEIGIISGYTADGGMGYGLWNIGEGEISELGQGVLIGVSGKVNNEATIHKIFDESILDGNSATGEAAEKPTDEEKAAPEFTDMANHWAAGDVSALATEGVIDGLPDGTFGPANDVTRGELAKLVLTVSGREEKSGEAAFADTEGTWSMKYVNGLAGVGIIREDDYPDGFRQGEEATRVEVITMLMRSMGYDRPMGEVELTFTDVDGLTDEQAYYVDCAVRRGIIKGMPDGTLKPDENISRAEVATMLRRAEAARPGK